MCPFCEGHEEYTPQEVLSYRRSGGPNGPGWDVRVVPNKFPALEVEGDLDRQGEGLYDKMNGVGAHEVIIETPDHTASLATMPAAGVERVLWAYRERVLDLKQDRRFRYILIFKNHGEAAGASLDHSHSQLIALPVIPRNVRDEISGARRHFEHKERCVFCDIVRQELDSRVRVISENADFVALSPYAPRFPFETWILPKRHGSNFEDAPRHEYESLARMLKDTLLRMNRALRVAAVQPDHSQRAVHRGRGRVLPLASRDHAEADESGGIRVGDRVLHQPDGARGGGGGPARGQCLRPLEPRAVFRARA